MVKAVHCVTYIGGEEKTFPSTMLGSLAGALQIGWTEDGLARGKQAGVFPCAFRPPELCPVTEGQLNLGLCSILTEK